MMIKPYERKLIRKSLREDIPDIKRVHIEKQIAPDHYIQKIGEKITHGKLTVKPVLYTWRPIGHVKKRTDTSEWAGTSDIYFQHNQREHTRTITRAHIIMPESTYKNPKTRAIVYAHELTEVIGATQPDYSETRSHQHSLETEKKIYKRYNIPPRKITHIIKKEFNEAYSEG